MLKIFVLVVILESALNVQKFENAIHVIQT